MFSSCIVLFHTAAQSVCVSQSSANAHILFGNLHGNTQMLRLRPRRFEILYYVLVGDRVDVN